MKVFRVKNRFLSFVPIIILLMLSFWAVRPLLSRGFFPMHDDTQVSRVIEMGRALRNGQFPVRWVGDLGYGYGYPLFNFYGPLPYYAGGFLYWLGIDALVATKAMFVLGILLSGITMYLLVSSFYGTAAGILAGVLYMYAPYHALDIYVRGAVGEFWALAFLPLIAYGLAKVREKNNKWIIGAIGLSGVILSHTILGYTTVIFVIFGILCHAFIRRIFVKNLVFLFLVGLGLSAFFWIPALWEMGATNVASQIGGAADFRNHFVCISQLWNSPWGFGGSAPGCIDGMSFQLGKLSILLALVAIITVFLTKGSHQKEKAAAIGGLLVVLVSIFFMTGWSQRIWETIYGFAYIQYPWRFLSFAIFGLSFMGSLAVLSVRSFTARWVMALGLSAVTIFFYAKLFVPQYVYDKPSSIFESKNDLQWRASKISDEYLPPNFAKPQGLEDLPSALFKNPGSLSVDTEIDTETYTKSIVSGMESHEIVVNRTAFPGWHYLVDGKDVQAIIVGGLPQLFIPSGRHVVEIAFSDTPVRYFGNLLTLFSIMSIFYILNRKI